MSSCKVTLGIFSILLLICIIICMIMYNKKQSSEQYISNLDYVPFIQDYCNNNYPPLIPQKLTPVNTQATIMSNINANQRFTLPTEFPPYQSSPSLISAQPEPIIVSQPYYKIDL